MWLCSELRLLHSLPHVGQVNSHVWLLRLVCKGAELTLPMFDDDFEVEELAGLLIDCNKVFEVF
jgi:hypothetical protein